ncbi:MAG TPA: hypothetical protein VF665_23200 [Longimicrobium sp.]|jgi:hypothetical protein|uniref:hypothetical protein n=1 Tax=Longimicrobium sp. TaxID=2029185 RepID=UPI002EDA8262
MPVPTTLDDFSGQARAAWAAAQATSRTVLSDATAALASARADLASATAAMTAARAALAATRAELEASTVPADQAVLIAQAAVLQAQARAHEAAVREAGEAVARNEARSSAGARFLAAANVGVSRAAAERTALEAEHDRLQALREAATEPPLDTLPAEVNDALAGPPYTDAKARVDGDLPAELVSAARASYAAEADLVAAYRTGSEAADDLLAAALSGARGHDAAVDEARGRLERAERRLRDWVDRARERFARAQAQLQAVADGGPLLTEAEDEVLDDDTDGAAAAALRATRETALGTLRTAGIAVDGALLAARAPDPGADVTEAAGVKSAVAVESGATTALNNAEIAYAPKAADYAALVSNVPDSAWARLLAFLEAEATLKELDAINPATLATGVEQAEKALAAALWARHAGALSTAWLAEQAALRQALYERARDSRPGRLLGAVRGDA